MINFNWKICDLEEKNKEIISVDYHLSADDSQNIVTTQGKWNFSNFKNEIAYQEITEQLVIRWLEEDMQESLNAIKLNLENQLQALKSTKSGLPWVKPTFKPNIGI